MQNKTKNYLIFILALAVIGLVAFQFSGKSALNSDELSSKEATGIALNFINEKMLPPGTAASLAGAISEKAVYQFNLEIGGEEFPSYISKDGKLLFPQAIDLEEVLAAEEASLSPPASSEEGVALDDNGSHFRGIATAAVTVIEFSDFQCPYCAKFHETMQEVVKNYPTEVKWVYKHFPLDSIHSYARQAAEASECAGEQGRFWEYADQLYVRQSEIKPSLFNELAQSLGLDTERFEQCLDSGKYEDKVKADQQEGAEAGVTGTPGSFLNGQALGGAASYEAIKALIDESLESK